MPKSRDRLHHLVSGFDNKNTFNQCFNSGPGSQTVASIEPILLCYKLCLFHLCHLHYFCLRVALAELKQRIVSFK